MHLLRAVGDWLDDRIGYRGAICDAWSAPGDADSAVMCGLAASVAACFAVLVVSGVALMTVYAPSPLTAWASVHFIQFVEPRGWVVRGLHFWAAQLLVGLSAVHVLYGVLVASHRPPREISWWLTLAVVALAIAQGTTGGLLPWDQPGWWARAVEGHIVGLLPVAGPWLQRILSGGPELGALGLTRAYTAHVVVLPAMLAIVLGLRRRLRPRHASPVRGAIEQAALGAAVAAGLVCIVLALTAWTQGAPLDAPADPSSDYPARPEWFLLSLYELRKLFHGPAEFWGTTIVAGAGGACFVLLPWIDRPGRPRAIVLLPSVLFATATALGVAAVVQDRSDPAYARARRKADVRAVRVARLAMGGVPPAGPLEMMRRDPELRGRDLFERHCASCHVMGDLGDSREASASKLDGWGTASWIEAMTHDPDGPDFFGRGPYKGRMPSVDARPKERGLGWSPIVNSPAERHAVAVFLASQGDDPSDAPHAVDEAPRALGEKIVNERCAKCHLFKGGGDDDGSLLAPELSGYGSLAWTVAQVRNPATPKTYRDKALDRDLKKHMPRFDTDLSEADIELVARWTRGHGRSPDRPWSAMPRRDADVVTEDE
jgi:ubiquinol-cytochrome c reductase cytochrome b subunit